MVRRLGTPDSAITPQRQSSRKTSPRRCRQALREQHLAGPIPPTLPTGTRRGMETRPTSAPSLTHTGPPISEEGLGSHQQRPACELGVPRKTRRPPLDSPPPLTEGDARRDTPRCFQGPTKDLWQHTSRSSPRNAEPRGADPQHGDPRSGNPRDGGPEQRKESSSHRPPLDAGSHSPGESFASHAHCSGLARSVCGCCGDIRFITPGLLEPIGANPKQPRFTAATSARANDLRHPLADPSNSRPRFEEKAQRFSTRRGRAGNCVGSHDSGRESTHHCGAGSDFASLCRRPNNEACVAYDRNITDSCATPHTSRLSPLAHPRRMLVQIPDTGRLRGVARITGFATITFFLPSILSATYPRPSQSRARHCPRPPISLA